MTITFFDILVLFGLFGGAAMGFYRGVVRQALATLIIYISIVVASVFYLDLSRILSRWTRQPLQTTDLLAFFIFIILIMVALFIARRDLIRNMNLDRVRIWRNILGMVVGVLNASIVCAVVLIVLRSTTGGEEWYAYQAVQTGLRRMLSRSFMAYVFRPFTYLILNLIQPWLFGGELPPLLRNAL